MSQTVIEENYLKLDCDEQIMTAVELGIISKYQVVYCMDDYDEIGGKHLKYNSNYCNGLYNPTIECSSRCPQNEIERCHSRLEDFYLKGTGVEIPSVPFILDIDLDFFQNSNSIKPESHSLIMSLIRKSVAITIARSSSYFNDLRIEQDLDIDEVEHQVVDFIKNCLK